MVLERCITRVMHQYISCAVHSCLMLLTCMLCLLKVCVGHQSVHGYSWSDFKQSVLMPADPTNRTNLSQPGLTQPGKHAASPPSGVPPTAQKPPPSPMRKASILAPPSASALASCSVNWRNPKTNPMGLNVITSVKDQANCGESCSSDASRH